MVAAAAAGADAGGGGGADDDGHADALAAAAAAAAIVEVEGAVALVHSTHAVGHTRGRCDEVEPYRLTSCDGQSREEQTRQLQTLGEIGTNRRLVQVIRIEEPAADSEQLQIRTQTTGSWDRWCRVKSQRQHLAPIQIDAAGGGQGGVSVALNLDQALARHDSKHHAQLQCAEAGFQYIGLLEGYSCE